MGELAVFASGVITVEHRPRCVECDRALKAHTEGRHYCPCCGEIYVRVEALVGLRVADSHGWTRTAMAVRERGAGEEMMRGPHACPPAAKSKTVDAPKLFEGSGR